MAKNTWWNDVDTIFDMVDGDDVKKKKKKGKKKKPGADTPKSVRKSLKGMSKSELLQRMDKLGIPLSGIDVNDKRAMKDAIVAKMTGGALSGPAVDDKVPVGLSIAEHEAKMREVKDMPPYYMDEDSGEFIIPNARDTDDMNCFNAMMSLGAVRSERRADDGFGELMRRLSKKLTELPEATPTEIIDVTDFQVIDAPVGLNDKPDNVPALPPPASDSSSVVTPEQLERINQALEKRQKQRKKSTKPKV